MNITVMAPTMTAIRPCINSIPISPRKATRSVPVVSLISLLKLSIVVVVLILQHLYYLGCGKIYLKIIQTKYIMQTKYIFFTILILAKTVLFAQDVPTITSFSPASGPVGTTVTITGTHFDATPANNTVFFGATQASVSAATTTTLTVTVPLGASYQPVSVLVDGLQAYSFAPFVVTFSGPAVIDDKSFAPGEDFSTGVLPTFAAIGDLDGDGQTDLAVTNQISGSVSVLRNTSTAGVISYATKMDFSTGSFPQSVAIGDLDGDGKADLAVANSTSNTVSVFRNTSTVGAISYAAKMDFGTGTGPFSVAIGDLDGDGRADLVVTNSNSNNVSVFRNTSTAAGVISYAAKVDFATGSKPQSVAIGDLDGDGKVDLAVANRGDNTVSVLRNTSTGVISYADKVDFTTGTNPQSVAIGDLDDDGKTDLAVANFGSSTVSVFRNTSTGLGDISYDTKVDFDTGSGSRSVVIGDLNGDGRADLAVANDLGQTVSILRNTSTGLGDISYAAKADFATGSRPQSVVIGNLNSDGQADLAVANYISSNVSVLLRNTSSETDITAFSFAAQTGIATIDSANHTVDMEVVYGTDVSALVADFTLSAGATARVGTVSQQNGVTANDFSSAVIYTVTAQDGITTQNWTVTVDVFTRNVPTITSFSPASGPVGTSVTITGTNFDATPAVFFGATPASVSTGTTTILTVTVPPGASYQPITVLTGGLLAYSSAPFVVTFSGPSIIDDKSFALNVDFDTGGDPFSVAIGDLDGDGKADLAVANFSSNSVSVFRNTSTGTGVGGVTRDVNMLVV